jgi:hypothetical protein
MLITKTQLAAFSLSIAVLPFGYFAARAAETKSSAPNAPKSKVDLTEQSFPKLWSLIRPHESEWRHLKVDWMTDVVAARKRAAEEDKPLVICYTGGAGYNEPLGVC